MSKKIPLFVAGLIFAVVAIGHLLRIVNSSEVMVSGHVIPMTVSHVCLPVALILSIWMLVAASRD